MLLVLGELGAHESVSFCFSVIVNRVESMKSCRFENYLSFSAEGSFRFHVCYGDLKM